MIKQVSLWIPSHFKAYFYRTPWDFCLRVTFEAYFLSFIVNRSLRYLGVPKGSGIDYDLNFSLLCILLIFVVPIIETLIFQCLPIGVLRLCKVGFSWQVFASVALFCIAHTLKGVGVAISVGVVGGFYLAFTYAFWIRRSFWTAFWTTCVSHMLRNAISLTIGILALRFNLHFLL